MAGITAYRSRAVEPAQEGGVGALVVHCSDARYLPHFQDFLRDGLGLPRYTLIAVPGGVHALTLTEYLPKFSWAGWRWVTFLENLFQPPRVILIGHEDCRWYKDARFHHLHGGADGTQHADLRRVRAEVQARFPRMAVETWFARLEGTEAQFTREP
jgi:hypothetical protein